MEFVLGRLWGGVLASYRPCSLTLLPACGWYFGQLGSVLTLMPTWVLWASARALRSLLPLLGPRKLLRNLVLYLRLSPQTPHCQACRLSRPGESSQVQRSMRPALHARASAWVRAAEDTAYRKAVSLKPVPGTQGASAGRKREAQRLSMLSEGWRDMPCGFLVLPDTFQTE